MGLTETSCTERQELNVIQRSKGKIGNPPVPSVDWSDRTDTDMAVCLQNRPPKKTNTVQFNLIKLKLHVIRLLLT